jgi:hypothetical protein
VDIPGEARVHAIGKHELRPQSWHVFTKSIEVRQAAAEEDDVWIEHVDHVRQRAPGVPLGQTELELRSLPLARDCDPGVPTLMLPPVPSARLLCTTRLQTGNCTGLITASTGLRISTCWRASIRQSNSAALAAPPYRNTKFVKKSESKQGL